MSNPQIGFNLPYKIPDGFCHCGCGKQTLIAARTTNRAGWIRAKPRQYVKGHNGRRYMLVNGGQDKICSSCHHQKPIEQFHRIRKGRSERQQTCAECMRRILNEYQTSEAARRWRENRKFRKYGLTKDEFENMLKEQNNLCAICKQPETSTRVKLLSVDHDHKTHRVRALLCNRCNKCIGSFEDDIELLQAAIEYLKKHLD